MSENISSGIIKLFADNTVFDLLGEVKYSMSTVEIEVIRGVDGHHSERHTPMTAFIEVKVSDSGNLDTGSLSGKRFDVVQAELLNGKSVKLNKAIQVNRVEVDAVEGSLVLRFEGTTEPDEETTS